MISVGRCVGTATSEDVEVFALIPRAEEPARPLREREDSLGIEVSSVSPACREQGHHYCGNDQTDVVAHATKCNLAKPNSSQMPRLDCRSPWPHRCL